MTKLYYVFFDCATQAGIARLGTSKANDDGSISVKAGHLTLPDELTYARKEQLMDDFIAAANLALEGV